MKSSKSRRRLPSILAISTIIAAMSFFGLQAYGGASAAPSPSPRRAIEQSWKLAARLGEFSYQTRVQQTVRPMPTLENLGLGSTQSQFYIEGQNNLRSDSLSMRIWSGGASPSNDADALEVEVVNGRTRGRIGDGEWQELDDISQLVAPGRDNLGFLAAAINVQHTGSETRAGIIFDRYIFDIDGPAFADYTRQQMEEELARKGALPPGVTLQASDLYADMTADGEIWIDEQGLPLRMVADLSFPPDDSEQTDVTITTDFSDWDQSLLAAATTWSGKLLAVDPRSSRQVVASAGLGLGFAGLLLLLYRTLGWRRLYKPFAVAMVAIMLLTMLLEPPAIQASYDRLDDFRSQQAASQAARESAQAARAAEARTHRPTFDPSQSPLAVGASAPATSVTGSEASAALQSALPANCIVTPTTALADSDEDGLTDQCETALGTNPSEADSDGDGLRDGDEVFAIELATDPNNSDTDGDGLSDGVEVLALGTDPSDMDTDGDFISDKTEVQGFKDGAGNTLYLDPLNPDTNGDSRGDDRECPALVDVEETELGVLQFVAYPTPNTICEDMDGDGDPDVFDRDDDGDGVPDAADRNPISVVAGGSKASGCTTDYNCLEGLTNNTFNFSVDSYTETLPLLVDFQVRPENPQHLWYMSHVLDWPDNDTQGQVTTGISNTFGTSGREAYGDLRLFPMLEITIPAEGAGSYSYPTLPKLNSFRGQIDASTPITAWLDTTDLESYRINVRKKDNAGTLVAYAPLYITEDPVGGSPVAFAGQMFYKPDAGNWSAPHQVKLVWMVEVLDASKNSQFIHVYEDDWYLTGLEVREDHGVDVALAYEDPVFAKQQIGYDAATYYEENLWTLARGLSESFVSARTGANGQRDMTVPTIKYRWDKSSNSGNGLTDGDSELWGIPKQALFVDRHQYAHQGDLGKVPAVISSMLTTTFNSDAASGFVT